MLHAACAVGIAIDHRQSWGGRVPGGKAARSTAGCSRDMEVTRCDVAVQQESVTRAQDISKLPALRDAGRGERHVSEKVDICDAMPG
eukprot:305528-Rhodomonas_salina.2